MPIQPIDLQVLFSRLDNIGREAVGPQQAAAQGQEVAGAQLAEQSRAQARRVTDAEELPDGSEEVKEDESGEEQESSAKRRRRSTGESDEAEDRSTETEIRDPALGRTIDLSG